MNAIVIDSLLFLFSFGGIESVSLPMTPSVASVTATMNTQEGSILVHPNHNTYAWSICDHNYLIHAIFERATSPRLEMSTALVLCQERRVEAELIPGWQLVTIRQEVGGEIRTSWSNAGFSLLYWKPRWHLTLNFKQMKP